MSLEKMNNMVEEEPQDYINNINNNESISKNVLENYSNNNTIYVRNYLHIIINTIINIGLLIIVIIEFIVRSRNDYMISNFDILVTIFICFEFIFIGANYLLGIIF